MKMFKLISVWGEETNPYANPDTCNDGGGYFQPSGGILVEVDGEPVIVEVDDLSCGEFGTRSQYAIDAPKKGMKWYLNVGTMDDAMIDSDEEIEEVLDTVYNTPTQVARKAAAFALQISPAELHSITGALAADRAAIRSASAEPLPDADAPASPNVPTPRS